MYMYMYTAYMYSMYVTQLYCEIRVHTQPYNVHIHIQGVYIVQVCSVYVYLTSGVLGLLVKAGWALSL